jgi:predicted transporter
VLTYPKLANLASEETNFFFWIALSLILMIGFDYLFKRKRSFDIYSGFTLLFTVLINCFLLFLGVHA